MAKHRRNDDEVPESFGTPVRANASPTGWNTGREEPTSDKAVREPNPPRGTVGSNDPNLRSN